MNYMREIRENRWGIILGAVWGLINVHNLLFSFILKKNLLFFVDIPFLYFILYFPMTILNLCWIIIYNDYPPVRYLLKEDFIYLDIEKSFIIIFSMLFIGISLGYLIDKLVNSFRRNKIDMIKEVKRHKWSIILGALWGEFFIISFFPGIHYIINLIIFSPLLAYYMKYLPIIFSASFLKIAYGENPLEKMYGGMIPFIFGPHGEFLLETLFFSFFWGILFGYLIDKSIKRLLRKIR